MFFAKHNLMIIGVLSVFPVVYFSSVSTQSIFINLQSKTVIIVAILSIITVFTGIQLVTVNEYSRHFTDVSRFTFVGGNMIYLSLPLAFASLIAGIKKDKLLFYAGILIIFLILVTITRRWIVAIFEYTFIISILVSFIHGRSIIYAFKKIFCRRMIALFTVLLINLIIIAPSYVRSTIAAVDSVYQTITGNPDLGSSDKFRLNLTSKTSMVYTIQQNLIIGTGYSLRWFNNYGPKDEWEGADYLFLGAFGQFGIVGLLLFLPFYIFAVRIIKSSIKLLKNNRNLVYSNRELFYSSIIVFLASSAEFIRNMMEYPNWFAPISASSSGYLFFIYMGLLLGSYISIERNIRKLSK